MEEDNFSFFKLYDSYRKCRKGVSWKGTVQRVNVFTVSTIYEIYSQLKSGRFRSGDFFNFDIIERGKLRHIQSVNIRERIVQRCNCDNILLTALMPKLIKENSACQKGKGIDYAHRILTEHLRKFCQKNNSNEGYILQFDFSKYFDNISHEKLIKFIKKKVKDTSMTERFVNDFDGEYGLGLGSQVSQISALFYPNYLDHYFKQNMHCKYYGRYMDDGYIISEDLDFLKECQKELIRICGELEIKVNDKKTHISKINKGFTFLKIRYFVTDSKKIVRSVSRKNVTSMRRKLKKFKQKLERNEITLKEIENSYNSWKGYVSKTCCHKTMLSMDKMYKEMFSKEKEYNDKNRISV